MKRNKTLNWVSKIVYRKSTNYLRISIVTLVFSIAILTICLSMIRKQTKQINDNFINNDNTHVIEISGKYKDQSQETVSKRYIDDISNILNKTKYKGQYKIFSMYQLKFGFDTEELDEPINIFSIDKIGEPYLIKGRQLENDILYTEQDIKNKKLALLIPKVSLNKNGVNIGKEKREIYLVDKIEKNTVFNVYDKLEVSNFFVNYDTFRDIFKKCFGKELSKQSLEETAFIEPIYKVYLYVDDIANVEPIAKIINNSDYLTNFVFQSFEDIGDDLSKSLITMFLVSLFLIIFTSINILMSMKGYVSLLTKDIGILKQMRYSEKEVMYIYSRIINTVFFKISSISTIVAVMITILILDISDIKMIIAYLCIINILMVVLNLVVKNRYLKKNILKNVLELVKAQRAFE